MKQKATILNSPDDISLDRHGMIEASAGTGKTYTIENLYLRLLLSPGRSIEQILTVTYTEKAAGEMKSRIRSRIRDAIRSLEKKSGDPALLSRLQQSLDSFDRAAIHTIHGFCHGLLQKYGFESGSSGEASLADDFPLAESALGELYRRLDARCRPEDLSCFLMGENFFRKIPGQRSHFETLLIRMALFPLEEKEFYRILPESGNESDPFVLLENFAGKTRSILQELDRSFRSLFSPSWTMETIREELSRAIPGKSIPKFFRETEEAFQLLGVDTDEILSTSPGMETIQTALESLLTEDRTRVLKPGKSKLADALRQWMEGSQNSLEGIHHERIKIRTSLAGYLREILLEEKRKSSRLSYDDLLLEVHRNLQKSSFLNAVRSEYTVGIVDEFQDTDPIQWSIFKKIFLGSPDHRLYLVGDPKQSIYRFRGADVETYLQAREAITAESTGGLLYRLNTSYRTRPSLLEALNHMFLSPHWFGPEQNSDNRTSIFYSPVEASGERKMELCRGDGLPSFRRVELKDPGRKGKREFADFLCTEIPRILEGPLRIQEKDRSARSIQPGDIAILVKKRSDGEILESHLRRAGIPHSFYKKPGFYLSREAMELEWLFRSLEEPGNDGLFHRALLTRFFGVSPGELEKHRNLDPDHPWKKKMGHWRFLAGIRKWPFFFQSLLEDSPALFSGGPEIGLERRIANFHHLREELEREALNRGLDLSGLIREIRSRRGGEIELSEESNLHRLETESSRIQILTMHASKGLEFPVVFLFAGFRTRENRNPTLLRYHDPKDPGGPLLITVQNDSEGKSLEKEEEDREEKRLYYVALTRARLLMYLPWIDPEIAEINSAPITSYIRKAIRGDDASLPGFPVIRKDRSTSIPAPESDLVPCQSVETLFATGDSELPREKRDPDLPQIESRARIRLDSYSSLQKKVPDEITFLDENRFQDHDEIREVIPPEKGEILRRYLNDEMTPSEKPNRLDDPLPPGAKTGDLIHRIFETIDFRLFQENPPASVNDLPEKIQMDLERYRREYGVEARGNFSTQEMLERALEVVSSTLRAPLPLEGENGNFRLCDLTDKDRIHEMEFFFEPEQISLPASSCLRGFIDLVFRKNGKYYLADWKTNTLPSYDTESMQREMKKAGYNFQADLYLMALHRHLAVSLPNYLPGEHLGGILYFFVRGIRAEAENDGILFFSRSPEEARGTIQFLYSFSDPENHPGKTGSGKQGES